MQLKKLIGQTAIYGLSTIVGRLLNYFLVPLYTYTFTPYEYGVNTEFYAYISFLNIILTYGMETALFNFSVKEPDKNKVYSTALISILFTTTVITCIILFASQTIANGLDYADKAEFITWVVLIIATDALCAIPFAKLREQNNAARFALIKSINIFVNIALNLFFILLCKGAYERNDGSFFASFYNPEIGIGYIFIANLVANMVSVLLLAPEFFMVKFNIDFALLKRMLVYAVPLLFLGLAGMVNETLDRVLLKYILPSDTAMEQVGIYGACYKIAILMTIFVQAFRYAAEPFFFSQSTDADAKTIYARVMTYFVIACSIIFLATMMNIAWIKDFISKPYQQGIDVVPILLLANMFLGIYFNLSVWYKLTGQTKYGAYITFIGALITIGLNLFWIPFLGYTGSAWATLICYGCMMVLSYLIGNKHYPVNYDVKRIIAYMAISLILYVVADRINFNSATINLLFKNGVLMLFVFGTYLIEKASFKKQYNG
jgi:O-antigen/teichoic acid export membrane protein